MIYIEMTVEEAIKICNKNATVLVAVHDLEDDNADIVFAKKRRNEYDCLFKDAATIASLCDDFMKQLNIFTEKQDIMNIMPKGLQKTIILRE